MGFSYQDGWFPFQIPEIAEDGAPFEVWDGSTLYGRYDVDLTSGDYPDDGYGNSQSTSGYSYSGKPSKSSSVYVTTVGPGSPYPVGPFNLEQLSELYWRVRDWNFLVAPVTAITSGTQSISSSISGTISAIRSDGTNSAAATPLDMVVTGNFPAQKFLCATTGYISTNYTDPPPSDIYEVRFSCNPPDDGVSANSFIASGWTGSLHQATIYSGQGSWGAPYAPVVAQRIPASGGTPARIRYWLSEAMIMPGILETASSTHLSPYSFSQSSSAVFSDQAATRVYENWTKTISVGGISSSQTHTSNIIQNRILIVMNTGTVSGTFDSQFTGNISLPSVTLTLTATFWHDYDGTYNTSTGNPV